MTTKPYTRLPLSEREFQLVRSSVSQQRAVAFARLIAAQQPEERAFYERVRVEFDNLLEKLDAVLRADTSQDAEPEEDEEEEED